MPRRTRKPPPPRRENRPAAKLPADRRAGQLRWPTVTAAGILVLAGLLAYANSFSAPFVFDSSQLLVEGARISRSLWAAMSDTGRPIADVTFAVNYALGGKNPWGYHAVNLAIHVAAALTLFGIVRRTLARGRLATRFAPASWGLAVAVALLWLVHPLQTQSVTYIFQRFESLMGLMVLLTLYCFIRAQDSPRAAWWYAATIACCLLAVLTKEVAAVTPLLVLWYDRALIAASWREIARRRWGIYAAMTGAWVVLAAVMLGHGHQYSEAGVLIARNATPLQYAASQPGVIAHYLRLCFWPAGLCIDHAWLVADTAAQIVPPLLLIAALLALTVWAMFRWPAWSFLGAWFFVILAPTSSIAPIKDLAFEHRMYLSLAAVVAAVVIGGYAACQALVRKNWFSQRTCDVAVGWAVAAVAAALAVATFVRNADYRSDVSLWQDTVAKAPHNARAEHYLAQACEEEAKALHKKGQAFEQERRHDEAKKCYDEEKKRYDEAIRHYWKTIAMLPDFLSDAYYNLGNTLVACRRIDDAIAQFRAGLDIAPNDIKLHTNLANALVRCRRYNDAVAHCRKVLAVDPHYAEANTNLGIALYGLGQLDAAIRCNEDALRVKPDHVAARDNLRLAFAQRARLDEAIEACQKSLALDPNNVDLRGQFAEALLQRGRLDEAIAQFRWLVDRSPDSVEGHARLAAALALRGRAGDAAAEYRMALIKELTPDLLIELGRALADQGRATEAAKEYRTAAEIYNQAGAAAAAQGQFAEAIQHYRRALDVDPHRAAVENNLAWLLATCPAASLRNGIEAVILAEEVAKVLGDQSPGALDTLAAAYAETGRFGDAVVAIRRAIDLAGGPKNEKLAHELRERLALYQAGKPFRQPPPAAPEPR